MPLQGKGRLYIVGSGPGSLDLLAPRAREVLEQSEYVIGNASYLLPLEPLLRGKEVIKSRMGQEIERAQRAINLAKTHVVSMVSGGDPGIYGMASIVLEILSRSDILVPVEVIPGISAAQAAGARLGSPLSGDHVVISLSDLLTPWEEIERRLRLAFAMNVPIVLYNPRSRSRPHHLATVIALAQEYRSGMTPIAVVQNAYREGETMFVTNLGKGDEIIARTDMHSTVFIGGEESWIWKERDDVRGIITPRGYHKKYTY